ncbi:MAG TPA: glycosyl hydrolase [Verrucomicrobiae bacterium]|nr:glycosyl hydrolase [Verrucomicrobiae bacterium]
MPLPALLILAAAVHAQAWIPQNSNSSASLRGVSVVDEKTVWASGSGGTVLHTRDGGMTWAVSKVPGAESLDFRGVRALDARIVYVMSAGSGEKSRIYKTIDAGEHWSLQFTNPDPKGFFDSMAFWDARHGIVLGDAINGHAEVLTTIDRGAHWVHQETPPALANEGSFAASNTCLFVLGEREVWFVTGGPGAARVFHSRDGGHSWTVASTPIRNDSASAGIFSIAFRDRVQGVIVGGDYAKDSEDVGNVAVTRDGGGTWTAPAGRPHGFRSAVAWLPDIRAWIATGTSGSDISRDDGRSWTSFDPAPYNAVSFISSRSGWAVGPRGRIARFRP